jgi:UPF0042 nucleotide-binding protein
MDRLQDTDDQSLHVRAMPDVVFVTGPSGAGRTTAINSLEDLGAEAIDNLPLSLLPRLLQGPPPERPMALGADARNRDYAPERLIELYASLKARPDWTAELLYLDCEPDVLRRRYSETRRRHPLAPDEDPSIGIARDIAMLAPVRAAASLLVDTTALTPRALRTEVTRLLAPDGAGQLVVTVTSFSYRRRIPQGSDMAFDCRFLRNPHWDERLRPFDGRSAEVQAYIAEDARFVAFRDQVFGMLDLLLPAFQEEGKAHLKVAFGCTGGQHRSVAMTEITAAHLAKRGWRVSKEHRELDQRPVAFGESGAPLPEA